MGIDPGYVASGFAVGVLVGLTGVGGGSLMTPLLVLLFGLNIKVAVGTDLLFAAATKTVGAIVHGSGGTVDWRVAGRLAAGSVPAAVLTVAALHLVGASGHVTPMLKIALGIGLIATAVSLIARPWLMRLSTMRLGDRIARHPTMLTIATGALLGVVVSLSSIGAGAIGMTALLLLYPRIPVARLVGADIAHAIPLTLVAGVGYWMLGSVLWPVLGSLLLGSIPGIVIASRVAWRLPEIVLRPVLAIALAAVGITMLG